MVLLPRLEGGTPENLGKEILNDEGSKGENNDEIVFSR